MTQRERNAELRLAEIRERAENWARNGRYEAEGQPPFPPAADVLNLLARVDRLEAQLKEMRLAPASYLGIVNELGW